MALEISSYDVLGANQEIFLFKKRCDNLVILVGGLLVKILKIILATVGVAMSGYSVITGTTGIIVPYVLLVMGGMLLVIRD